MHYKLFYPSEYLAACDLQGKDARVTIEKVQVEEVVGADGKKQTKPVVTFRGKQKRMVLCKTNAKAIAAQCESNDTDQWTGRTVIIYPTTCQAFGQTVECIRVR